MSLRDVVKMCGVSVLAIAAGSAVLLAAKPTLAQSAYEQLVAMATAEASKVGGEIKMALDWPDADAKPVIEEAFQEVKTTRTEEFMKAFPFVKKIDYERESGVDPFGRYLIGFKQGEVAPYDIMHVASEYEQQYLEAGIFEKPPFEYQDLGKSLPAG